MENANTELRELADLFSKFEHDSAQLTGRDSLKRALDRASDLLLDQSRTHLRGRTTRLVFTWFERVSNLRHLCRSRKTRDFEALRLHDENVELFSDPIFQLPRWEFDEQGLLQAATILVAKPKRYWTTDDRRRVDDLIDRGVRAFAAAELRRRRGP